MRLHEPSSQNSSAKPPRRRFAPVKKTNKSRSRHMETPPESSFKADTAEKGFNRCLSPQGAR